MSTHTKFGGVAGAGTVTDGVVFVSDGTTGAILKSAKVIMTIPASNATITIASAKTFTCSNTLTLSGTDSSTLNIGTGGTLGTAAYTASSAYEASGAVSTHSALKTGIHGITIASTFATSGAFAVTLTATASTSVTLPTSGTLATTTQVDAKLDALITQNAQTGTSYTLVLTDINKLVTMSNASANALTVPLNASVAYSTGSTIAIQMIGAGVTTISGATGVTINGVSAGSSAMTQYQTITLVKIATDTWLAIGGTFA